MLNGHFNNITSRIPCSYRHPGRRSDLDPPVSAPQAGVHHRARRLLLHRGRPGLHQPPALRRLVPQLCQSKEDKLPQAKKPI